MLFLLIDLVSSVCFNSLLLDDYQNYPRNLVGGTAGDDSTMSAITPNKQNSSISVVALNQNSYYYEAGYCPINSLNNYTSFSINVVPPPGASFAINFQTAQGLDLLTGTSCKTNKTNNYVFVNSSMNAWQANTITVPIPKDIIPKLIGISIESLKPWNQVFSFSNLTLMCPPEQPQSPDHANTSNTQRNPIHWLLALIFLL
ncbi:hypothetical protein HDV06_000311 [Boothiomyces sp. JEL0866]|nr:hypothetical protein HDV06_000311 [Boothiomyces sp. JEL0866]